MPALIVGASGQVGTLLRATLANAIPAWRMHSVEGGAQLDLATVDASGAARLLRQHDVDAVYNCGAATFVDGCEDSPDLTMKVNRDGPAVLAGAAAARGIPFVHLSTDFVFDGTAGPYSEDDVPHPLSVYGRSKLEGEQAILAAYPDALIVRTTLVYGRDPNGKNFAYALGKAVANGRPIRVPADQITTPTWNADLAAALAGLVRSGQRGVFHVASGERMSRYDFAVRAARAAGLDASLVQPVKTADLGQKASRPLDAGLHVDKLLRTLPGLELHSIEAAMGRWLSAPDPLFARREVGPGT